MKVRSAKSCLPKMAAISGVMKSATKAVTMAVKAAPMTTGHGQVDDVAPQDELLEIGKQPLTPATSGSQRELEAQGTQAAEPGTAPEGARGEPEAGIEPATSSLQVKCSTN